MKRIFALLFAIACPVLLTQCSEKPPKPKAQAANEIRIGTIAGPETELMEVAKNVAAEKYGLKVQIVQFNDYVLPNQALADGSIDANMFQHQPYLNETIKAKGYPLSSIGKTFIYPMGIYSNKITRLAKLKNNALVAVPNDPSNEARALLLLEKAGLIKLREGTAVKATPADIIDNPKQIQIKELDAAQLPRAIKDVDLAVINTNYAMLVGLLPSRNALFVESNDSPYANIVVVRTEDKDNPKYIKLMDALHSADVIKRAELLFHGQALPAWQSGENQSATP